MTIDVTALRAEADEIGQEMGGVIAPPGTGDDRNFTWPAVACIILLAIFYEVRKIRRLIKKSDD